MKTSTAIVLSFVLATTVISQKLPPGRDVLERIAKGTQGVQDYVVDMMVDVNMERIRIPRAKATMYFKKPDKVHYESPSIAMLPREGMAITSSAVLENYTAETIGSDTVNGTKTIKLQLAAREATARLRQLFAWVNPENWTVTRIQTIPYQGRLLTMDFAYALQDDKYWMPSSLTARFDLLNEAGAKKPEQPSSGAETPLDQMQARAPRSGSISIEYSNYRINQGISDDIFKSKQEKK